jgi:hypothetical protein
MANAEDEEFDEDDILKQAMALSMGDQQQKEQQQTNIAEFLDNDFVGSIVKDLNLDVSDADINKMMEEMGKGG